MNKLKKWYNPCNSIANFEDEDAPTLPAAQLVVKTYKYTEHRTQFDRQGRRVCRKVIKWDRQGNFKTQYWVHYE
jgi:hypothetical protein